MASSWRWEIQTYFQETETKTLTFDGKTWVAGNTEPISPRVAESMLGGNIRWTRRGMPFLDYNRWYDGIILEIGDPDLFPRVAIALIVGQTATEVALPPKTFSD